MANRIKILLLLLTLNSLLFEINGHVALTFPPARKYDLDFLDNSRTPAPCGMPKGKSHFPLKINQSLNIPEVFIFLLSNLAKNIFSFLSSVNHHFISFRPEICMNFRLCESVIQIRNLCLGVIYII
jgi:preprotein translocase subunit SecY